MTLENLLGKGLQQEPSNAKEIHRFLAKVAIKLTDAQSRHVSLDESASGRLATLEASATYGTITMGTISVTNLGRAYKQFPTLWSRLAEWALRADTLCFACKKSRS